MDEDTLRIVASNLTVAYFSIKPDQTIQDEIIRHAGQTEKTEDKVFTIYQIFYNRLTKPSN